jgi:hypothetical protein
MQEQNRVADWHALPADAVLTQLHDCRRTGAPARPVSACSSKGPMPCPLPRHAACWCAFCRSSTIC